MKTASLFQRSADLLWKSVLEFKLKQKLRGLNVAHDVFPTRTFETIIEKFKQNGIPVQEFPIDYEVFHQWQRDVYDKYFPEAYKADREKKTLEHYLSIIFLNPSENHVLMDVATSKSKMPDVAKLHYGLKKVYRQDLIHKPGVHGEYIGSNANQIPLPDGSIDIMTLHNSYEHFEANYDAQFIPEAHRLLKKDGKVCIIPVFLADEFYILTSPAQILKDRRVPTFSPRAQIVISDKNPAYPIYSKHFSVEELLNSIINPHRDKFDFLVYAIIDPKKILSCPFALVLNKREPS
jgi:hypothetical protein